jgi:hypothetical protein
MVKAKPTANRDKVGLYTADAVEAIEGLTLGGHLLMALMAGGDYSDGLEGCGGKIAHGLARCGFGDSLLTAFNTRNSNDLHAFLKSWVEDIRDELRTNNHGFLPSCRPKLAESISCQSISLHILEFYVQPVSSFFPAPQNLSVTWRPREIHINRIAEFCVNHLGWEDANALRKTVHFNLWEGVFLQMLISVRPITSVVQIQYLLDFSALGSVQPTDSCHAYR